MKVRSPQALNFACHQASCAPPPAGTGGSSASVGGRDRPGAHTKSMPAIRAATDSDVGKTLMVTQSVSEKHPQGVGWLTSPGLVVSVGRHGQAEVRFGRNKGLVRAHVVAGQ